MSLTLPRRWLACSRIIATSCGKVAVGASEMGHLFCVIVLLRARILPQMGLTTVSSLGGQGSSSVSYTELLLAASCGKSRGKKGCAWGSGVRFLAWLLTNILKKKKHTKGFNQTEGNSEKLYSQL
jgi:hypothetical protein